MDAPTVRWHILSLLLPVTTIVIIPFLLLQRFGIGQKHLAIQFAAAIFFGFGFWLFSWSVNLFHNVGKGTLAPWKPTKHLVISGPYRYCRNPMISGVLLMISTVAIFFASFSVGVWAAVFCLANNAYFITKEEPKLKQKHGAEYSRYMKKVPRWIPTVKPYENS